MSFIDLIDVLISGLYAAELTPDAEQVADAIWLAAYLEPTGRNALPSPPEQNEPSEQSDSQQDKSNPPQSQKRSNQGGETRPSQDTKINAPDKSGKEGNPRAGISFPTPGAEALPHKLAISRALRPLVRYLPSQIYTVLDEQQSAELMAETGLPLLVLQPEQERWLKGIILVDTWPSMAVWADTAQEFNNLLAQLGAFTRLQSYTVVSQAKTAQITTWPSETTQRLLNPKELIDPTGRTLVFLLTDFASPAWATGAIGRLLEPLAQRNHLTVVSLIPDSRWSHTILADGVAVRLAAPYANAPNQRLTPMFPIWYEKHEQQDTEKSAICPPLPLTILTPQALPHWIQFFLGNPAATVPGYYLPLTSTPPKPKKDRELTDKLWEHFVATTPREIRRLAAYLATAPLTLPVMRLVQQEMLPKLTQADLATLLDSYLIYPIAETVDFNNPNELQWEFIRGARERLLTTIPLNRIEDVFERVSAYIEKYSGSRYNFHSYIFLDNGNEMALQGLDDAFGEAFAHLSLANLNYLGEKYKKVAAQLAANIENSEATSKKRQKASIPEHLLKAYDGALTLLHQEQFQAARQDLADLLSQLPDEEPFKATVKEIYYEVCQKVDIQKIVRQMSKAIDSEDIISASEQVKAIKHLADNNQNPILQVELDELVNELTEQLTFLRNKIISDGHRLFNKEELDPVGSESSVPPHTRFSASPKLIFSFSSSHAIEDHILIHLSEAMPEYLSETELREVYFRLHIDWTDLSLGGKRERLLALLAQVKRRKALIPLLIMSLYKVNPSVEWLRFPDQILPEHANELREIKRLIVIGDALVGLQKLNPTIAERLSIQIDGLLNELNSSKATQSEKSDLQDWSRDINARLIERDNANRVFEPPSPKQLHKALHEAGNPFPYLSAEDEISSLVKKRLFWDRHPVFYSLLNSQDKITIVHGESGSGRTAFCWGLYAYEPYHTANDFLIYIPYDASRPPKLREHVAQNIWSYIVHKPTLLNKLDQTQLHLLANHLAQVLKYQTMQDGLLQASAEKPWVKLSNVQYPALVNQEGLELLNIFQKALEPLSKPTTYTPNEEDWLRNIRKILRQMAFRFERFRILLDYQGTTQSPQTLRTQTSTWADWGINVVVFMTTTEYERHFPQSSSIPTYELAWSPEQLRELVYYRISRQLRNHDQRRTVGNSDHVVNALFASPEARDAWLASGKTPRMLFAVWQKMLELYSDEKGVLTKSLVDEAKILANNSENILTKDVLPKRDKTKARNKIVTGRLRDGYDAGKFVGRQEAINQAEQWRYSGKRLLSIIGIPGIGKTWLHNYLIQLWDEEPNNIILHLDLQPYINAQQTEYPREPFGESTHFFEAGQQFIEQCDVGVVYEPVNEFAVTVKQVGEHLCEKHAGGYFIYFFVDGADDLSPEEWSILESQLIEPLCRCAEIRFVISLRESQRIQSFPLRSQEDRLELALLTKEEGYKQLKLFGINEKQVDGLIAQGYQFEHPGINLFLATKILDPQSHSYIDVNFLRELLLALGFIPSHQPDEAEYAIKLLLGLAYLPDQWSIAQYRQHRDLTVNEGWEEIDFLQQHYLIVSNSAYLYRVAPGLLPFLRIAQQNMTRK